MNVCFKVYGKPRGKERPRFANGHIYTPKTTKLYEEAVAMAYKNAVSNNFSFGEKPIYLQIFIYFEKAKSNKLFEPITKPDIDNVIKSVMDGLNGVAYNDDKQVVSVIAAKRFANPDKAVPYVIVNLTDNDK